MSSIQDTARAAQQKQQYINTYLQTSLLRQNTPFFPKTNNIMMQKYQEDQKRLREQENFLNGIMTFIKNPKGHRNMDTIIESKEFQTLTKTNKLKVLREFKTEIEKGIPWFDAELRKYIEKHPIKDKTKIPKIREIIRSFGLDYVGKAIVSFDSKQENSRDMFMKELSEDLKFRLLEIINNANRYKINIKDLYLKGPSLGADPLINKIIDECAKPLEFSDLESMYYLLNVEDFRNDDFFGMGDWMPRNVHRKIWEFFTEQEFDYFIDFSKNMIEKFKTTKDERPLKMLRKRYLDDITAFVANFEDCFVTKLTNTAKEKSVPILFDSFFKVWQYLHVEKILLQDFFNGSFGKEISDRYFLAWIFDFITKQRTSQRSISDAYIDLIRNDIKRFVQSKLFEKIKKYQDPFYASSFNEKKKKEIIEAWSKENN